MTRNTLLDGYDVVVIGAGPAGLAAAAMTAEAGLSTLLVDENSGPGGQIYRSITSTPITDPTILGSDYWHGKVLVDRLLNSGATYLTGAVVWSLDADLVVGITHSGGAQLVQARRVIIATGALERPFPIPGWTLPGVMTVGAAQTLLKSSAIAPSGRTVIAGLGPLIWLYASQLLRLGGRIEAILDTTPIGNYAKAARHLPAFALSPLRPKGLALLREVKRQVRVIKGVTLMKAHGDACVRRVTFTTRDGTDGQLDVDTLLLHQGVVPNVNLAMSAGVAHRWNSSQHCWGPILDRFGGTSISGIAIAGDGGGIAGALVAEEHGRLAAISAIHSLCPGVATEDEQVVRQRILHHQVGRRFIDVLFSPPKPFRVPSDETLVCRCEEVSAGEIRETARLGCQGANQMKAFRRTGMGPCQGRLCGLTVTEMLADMHGKSPDDVGYFRIRPPVKPITLGELGDIPADAASNQAVVRP